MKWAKIRYALLFGLCLLLLLLFPSCTPAYAYQTYMIKDEELTKLEQNLETLERNSQDKQKLLETQSEQLKKLNEQLSQSLRQNEETQNSLANAEKYLEQYEKEMEHKQTVKERQRNMWILIAGIATAWAITK